MLADPPRPCPVAAYRYWLATCAAVLWTTTFASTPVVAGLSAPFIQDVVVGFGQVYKVGVWTPIRVTVGIDEPLPNARIEVTAPDSDGVEMTVSAPLYEIPLATVDDGAARHMEGVAFTRVGRVGAPLTISVFSDDKLISEWVMRPGAVGTSSVLTPLPPTAELQLALGDSAFNLLKSLGSSANRRVTKVNRVTDMPTDWFGYDAANVLVISGADVDLLKQLAADKERFAALSQWLELGGRLVILCGGDDARALLADGGPLARLAPGKLDEVVRLPETAAIEHFAKTGSPLATLTARTPVFIPRMVDIDGKIEVYEGRQPTDFPLIIRSPRGLGEVTFVALDFTRPPIAEWDGRTALLQGALRPYVASATMSEASEALVSSGYNDLSGALRQRLGRSFVGVALVSFPIVAALALAYVLVLGPLDYFVIQRWLKRPLAAWVTFPLIVLLFGASALAIADWRSGGTRARINQLELVDIDTTTGQMRGTYWATLYSPHAEQFDLTLSLGSVAKLAEGEPQALLTWWGLPGTGIGGMQGRSTDLGIRGSYNQLGDTLEGLPVLTSSTKSLSARWTATRAQPVLNAVLVDKDGLATGSLENLTGEPLRNVRLFYNGFAYRLGNLEPNQRIQVGEQSSPRSVKTVVTQDASGASVQSDVPLFRPEQATVKELLNLMMFYELAGGLAFAKLPFEYQAYCDLSRTLELGRAILVADAPTGGSRLVERASNEPLGGTDSTTTLTYRFVVPVTKNSANP